MSTMHGRVYNVPNMFQKFVNIYMKRTYLLLGIKNYILSLHWGSSHKQNIQKK